MVIKILNYDLQRSMTSVSGTAGILSRVSIFHKNKARMSHIRKVENCREVENVPISYYVLHNCKKIKKSLRRPM